MSIMMKHLKMIFLLCALFVTAGGQEDVGREKMPHKNLRGGEEKMGKKAIGKPCGNDEQCITNKCMPTDMISDRPTDRMSDRPTDRISDRPTNRGGDNHKGKKKTCQLSCGVNTLSCVQGKCPMCGPDGLWSCGPCPPSSPSDFCAVPAPTPTPSLF